MTTAETTRTKNGRVLFAYDGSDVAKRAIEVASRLVAPGRDAIVLTIWHPFDVGFLPTAGTVNAADPELVRKAAERTAAAGALLAARAGFRAGSEAIQGTPSWIAIVDAAEAHDADLIVLGSHGRTGRAYELHGSVAGAVAEHSRRSVLIVHRDSTSGRRATAGESSLDAWDGGCPS